MRLSAATALRQDVREEPAGTGGEVGIVVCKPGGKAAGETGDGGAGDGGAGDGGAGVSRRSRRSRRQPEGSLPAGAAGARRYMPVAGRPARPAPRIASGSCETRHVTPHVTPRVE
jgi:hypothetical protein